MSHEIDLTLLRAFVAVAETGGMTIAGRQLHLTQAAVSQQIKRLEERFQVVLFDRSQKQIALAPAGERLLAHAHRLLAMNDEVWGVMTAPDFEGEIKLGVPHDLVPAFLAPILRSFNKAWPRIDVSLICLTTPILLKALKAGEIDLTLTTEDKKSETGTLLLIDNLVWTGARDGDAHSRRPLPVSMGDKNCAFRPTVINALTKARIDWRFVSATSDMAAMCAAIEADLAVASLLSQTVPENLHIFGPESDLPTLQPYFINLYLGPRTPSEIVAELARHIEESFKQNYAAVA